MSNESKSAFKFVVGLVLGVSEYSKVNLDYVILAGDGAEH